MVVPIENCIKVPEYRGQNDNILLVLTLWFQGNSITLI
jgi:hypothetical protein